MEKEAGREEVRKEGKGCLQEGVGQKRQRGIGRLIVNNEEIGP